MSDERHPVHQQLADARADLERMQTAFAEAVRQNNDLRVAYSDAETRRDNFVAATVWAGSLVGVAWAAASWLLYVNGAPWFMYVVVALFAIVANTRLGSMRPKKVTVESEKPTRLDSLVTNPRVAVYEIVEEAERAVEREWRGVRAED